jgi:RNA polymerase sigma-70 factor (ECF subfamily)
MTRSDDRTRFPDVVGDDADWPAYEALVRDHYGRLCACAARYVGPGAAAEDVVQDVLLRVWRHRQRLGDVNLLAYLVQSIHNAAVSVLRREHTDAARGERLAMEWAAQEAPAKADVAERDEIARAVAAAIESLPDRCRLIFLLHRDTGLTYREIADHLGLSIKTVETQMGRALRTLRERLAPLLCAALCVFDGVTKRLLG